MTPTVRTRIEKVAKDASNPESAKGFLELGYSFASSEIAELLIEIEALNKEIDILRKYKSLSEEILSKVPCDNGDIHQSNLYLFGFKNAVRELKEFKQANKL
jgi:hypothetical protein